MEQMSLIYIAIEKRNRAKSRHCLVICDRDVATAQVFEGDETRSLPLLGSCPYPISL